MGYASLAAAFVALLLAVWGLVGDAPGRAVVDPGAASNASEVLLRGLSKRLEQMETLVAERAKDTPSATAPVQVREPVERRVDAQSATEVTKQEAEIASLRERLRTLEDAVQRFLNGDLREERKAAVIAMAKTKLGRDAIEGYRSVVKSHSETVVRRVAAIEMLSLFPPESNAIDDEVLAAAIALLRQGGEAVPPAMRIEILRNVGHRDSAAWKQACIEAMQGDRSRHVRARCVMVLARLLKGADRRTAFEAALLSETDSEVREALEEALAAAK